MNAVAEIKPKSVLLDMANRFGMEPAAFEATVRATCMRPDKDGRVPTREEFAAFLLVAKEYGLNPLTKEIYAFPAKGGGIVPVVSLDGWSNLINSQQAMDGMEFDEHHGDDGNLISITCRIYRKDRSKPTEITEYLVECIRNTDPWKMKHRMLRHKSLIQCARYAFGFAGIYDEDEGAKIAEMRDITPTERPTPPKPPAPKKAAPKATDEPKETTPTIDHIPEEPIEEETFAVQGDSEPQESAESEKPFDLTEYLDEIETALAGSNDLETLEENWAAADAEATLEGRDDDQAIALSIYKRHKKRIRDGAK